MFCKSCGEQIDDDSKYCSFCGTKQSSNLKPNLQDKIDASNYRDYKDNIVEQSITNSASLVSQTKYDPTYKKEEDVMVVGILLLLLAIVFSFIGPRRFQDNDTFAQFKAISAVVSLILRIFISIWVVKIAKRQNRDEYRWGLFAFILPSIALIVIATRRKLFANVEIVGGVSNEENSKMLAGKAQTYFSENKFSESLRGVIFSLFGLSNLVTDFFRNLSNTNAFAGQNIAYIVTMLATKALTLGFFIHVLLRSFWVSLVALSSMFPNRTSENPFVMQNLLIHSNQLISQITSSNLTGFRPR